MEMMQHEQPFFCCVNIARIYIPQSEYRAHDHAASSKNKKMAKLVKISVFDLKIQLNTQNTKRETCANWTS